ncbi:MAG: teichoic acid biosynthesis protein [Deltaproteobacteria bacterium]|nr:teichoic acid biosynthesis protein [Deltaproteobacteria bacterium]
MSPVPRPLRILYGVVGEGMGHAMRSAVILEHLTASGHDVRIVGSGRAAGYLASRYPDRVTEITGLTMVYEHNTVRKLKTALQNLGAARGLPDNLRTFLSLSQGSPPDVVVSDFESFSYLFARSLGLPVVSVDNMQIIDRCAHRSEVLKHEYAAFLLAKSIVKAKLPRANAYLVTTFFYPRIRKDRTSLHPPILRRVILDAKAKVARGDHVLVYQSGTSHEALVDELKTLSVPFRVYGLRRVDRDVREGNLVFRPFSEDTFIEDLATARAVIAGGGFTLMGEAVFLGKPMLSVPLVGQFEQAINASYLQQLGYGLRTDRVSARTVARFLDETERYSTNLESFEHDRNAGIFAALDSAMLRAIEEGGRA